MREFFIYHYIIGRVSLRNKICTVTIIHKKQFCEQSQIMAFYKLNFKNTKHNNIVYMLN